jgi:diaminopimelate decarboxylase
MIQLGNQVSWALQSALYQGLLDETDKAVIFESDDILFDYLNHLRLAFYSFNVMHAVAVKTNPSSSVLKKIVNFGFGLEAASLEEVMLAVNAGAKFENIVFDSPVKTKAEIDYCHQNFPGLNLNVNCLEELDRIPADTNFKLGIRINPVVDTDAPEIYNVSTNESKFGVPISQKEEILNAILIFPVTQLHVHSGSNVKNTEATVEGIKKMLELALEANQLLNSKNIQRRIDTLDIGGGLAPELLGNDFSNMLNYAAQLEKNCPALKQFKIITEFGQWVHFYAGFAVSCVEYLLKRGKKNIAFLHLGADYLLRDAYVKSRNFEFFLFDKDGNPIKDVQTDKYDLAGPLCFSGDYIAKDVTLPMMSSENWLAIAGTGSNSYGLWSRHCSRTIPKIISFSVEKNSIVVEQKRFNAFL